ncbi:MAG: SCO family protein [Holosporales bacterium]|jgi:protein SCO1/2
MFFSRFHRIVLYITFGSLVAAIMLLAGAWVYKNTTPAPVAVASVGAPFQLTNQYGADVTQDTFKGKPFLVFFGFTHCPDVCPTGLATITTALKALPQAQQDAIVPVFITVDPARDTPAVLKDYLAAFHPGFIGLTGSEESIKNVLKGYRAYAAPSPATAGQKDYLMDHSALIYWMNARGEFVQFFSGDASAAEITAALAAGL